MYGNNNDLDIHVIRSSKMYRCLSCKHHRIVMKYVDDLPFSLSLELMKFIAIHLPANLNIRSKSSLEDSHKNILMHPERHDDTPEMDRCSTS